jgi:hypothetical protein
MELNLSCAILLHGELVRHRYNFTYAFVRRSEETREEFIHGNFSSGLDSEWEKYILVRENYDSIYEGK